MTFQFLSRLACGLMLVFIAAHQAQATTVDITKFDTWYQFDVDELVALDGGLNWIDAVTDSQGLYVGDGSLLTFSLTLTHRALLTVVDGGVGGDVFLININGTSRATNNPNLNQGFDSSSSDYIGTNFNEAFYYPDMSQPSPFAYEKFYLDAGVYQISGSLLESASYGGVALNATVGGLKVSPVPLPAAAWLLLSALGSLAFFRRRQ
jgi:hypothetical protein